MSVLVVNDIIQESNDFQQLFLVRDGILLASLWAFWSYADSEVFGSFVKVTILFFVARYILSELTLYEQDSKKHFQISARLGLFVLVLSFAKDHILSDITFGMSTSSVVGLAILFFGLLQIVTKNHFATELVFTWLLVTRILQMFNSRV